MSRYGLRRTRKLASPRGMPSKAMAATCRPRRVTGMRKGLIQRWKKMPSSQVTSWGGGLDRLAPGARMVTSRVCDPALAPAMQNASWASDFSQHPGAVPAGRLVRHRDVNQVDNALEAQVVLFSFLGFPAEQGIFQVHSASFGCQQRLRFAHWGLVIYGQDFSTGYRPRQKLLRKIRRRQMTLSAEKFGQGMNTEQYIDSIKVNKDPFCQIHDGVAIPDSVLDYFNGLEQPVNLAVFNLGLVRRRHVDHAGHPAPGRCQRQDSAQRLQPGRRVGADQQLPAGAPRRNRARVRGL